jgi:hypothetical protein
MTMIWAIFRLAEAVEAPGVEEEVESWGLELGAMETSAGEVCYCCCHNGPLF